jgi:hypothetical protein
MNKPLFPEYEPEDITQDPNREVTPERLEIFREGRPQLTGAEKPVMKMPANSETGTEGE